VPFEPQPDHWRRWHDAYLDPSSELSHRLAVVQAEIRTALDTAPTGPIQVLSLCAGQGHDLLGVLRDHPRSGDVRARLIELDAHNARVARSAAERAGGARIEIVETDAGVTDAYLGAVPADLVLLVGIFGNVPEPDIERTAMAVPMLSRTGGTVIWTRSRRAPDLTPTIRHWFARAGCEEVAFVAPVGSLLAVGVERLAAGPAPLELGRRLFAFT
jgi:hypothetical protein